MRISPKGYCPSYFDYCMVIDEMLPQKVKPVVHSFDFLIFWRMMVTMEMVVEPQSSRFGQFLALIIPNIVIHDICFFAVIPRKLGRRTCGDVQISTICEAFCNLYSSETTELLLPPRMEECRCGMPKEKHCSQPTHETLQAYI
ncbi:hypothetical protein SAY86_005932 [Trapa natans]|uniref:Uncharacterized protein n=1 Tax=Trapa natans TaxID=22666 RepID=A0AAN7QRV9_TRANT|nr:hypothetical protein SAY86_005932 [Trapa natans]